MSDRPLPAPGPDMVWVNRRILAERLGWPDGLLQVCQLFELQRPGWSIWWRWQSVVRNFEHPAGFTATHARGQTVCGDGEPDRSAGDQASSTPSSSSISVVALRCA